MNKELSPLEALERLYDYPNLKYKNMMLFVLEQENLPKYYKIIETALKDYENLQLKHSSMQDAVLDDFKKLKALEIIKEKSVDVFHLQMTKQVSDYNFWKLPTSKRLKKQEYELLKEVLL